MISDALAYLRHELKQALGVTEVFTEHVWKLKESGTGKDGAFISLIKVEEEASLRNSSHTVRVGATVQKQEPPVYLNLYVLFAFEFDSYDQSLIHLSKTVELFQTKRVISKSNADDPGLFPDSIDKLLFELHKSTFEELNHVWGVLGGNLFPCLIYKVRMLELQGDTAVGADEIKAIKLATNRI